MALARVLLRKNAGWFSLIVERQLENASLSRERQERILSTLNLCVAFLGRIVRRKSFFASTTGKVAKMAVVRRLAQPQSVLICGQEDGYLSWSSSVTLSLQ